MFKKIALFVVLFMTILGLAHGTNDENLHFKDSLSITSAKVEYSKEGNKEKIYNILSCIGKIKNTSDIKWNNIVIEVQVLNAQHELVDTINKYEYDLLIPPHEEVSFKLSEYTNKDKNDYSEHKIRILSAEPVIRYKAKKKSLAVEILTMVVPLLVIILFFYFLIKKTQGKNSPPYQIVEGQKKQTELFEKQLKLVDEQNHLFKQLIDVLKQR